MTIEGNVFVLPDAVSLSISLTDVVSFGTWKWAEFAVLDYLVDVEGCVALREVQLDILEIVIPAVFACPWIEPLCRIVHFKDLVNAIGVPDRRPGRNAERLLDGWAYNPAMDQDTIGKVEPISVVTSSNAELAPLALEIASGLI